jgi:hypothetical protein
MADLEFTASHGSWGVASTVEWWRRAAIGVDGRRLHNPTRQAEVGTLTLL